VELITPILPAPVFLPRSVRYVVGLDLGQSSDPTAIAVIQHTKGVLDAGTELERHCGLSTVKQTPAEHFDVRHLERLPLGTSYPAVVQHIKDLLSRPPLCGHDSIKPAQLVIDESGVGRAVGDIFSEAGLKPFKVSITAGALTWRRRF
jgi:hypothetical protein